MVKYAKVKERHDREIKRIQAEQQAEEEKQEAKLVRRNERWRTMRERHGGPFVKRNVPPTSED